MFKVSPSLEMASIIIKITIEANAQIKRILADTEAGVMGVNDFEYLLSLPGGTCFRFVLESPNRRAETYKAIWVIRINYSGIRYLMFLIALKDIDYLRSIGLEQILLDQEAPGVWKKHLDYFGEHDLWLWIDNYVKGSLIETKVLEKQADSLAFKNLVENSKMLLKKNLGLNLTAQKVKTAEKRRKTQKEVEDILWPRG